MKEDRCTPNMAKGTLLAKEVRVSGGVIARGRIIGNDEIVMLNEAGVASVEVIRIGLSDLFADAAVDHVNRRLAGEGLLHVPSRKGHGVVFSSGCGILEYDEGELDGLKGELSDFAIEAKPSGTVLPKGMRCVKTRSIPLTVHKPAFMPVIGQLPRLAVSPRRTIRAALFASGEASGRLIGFVSSRLSDYGSAEVHSDREISDNAALTIALAKSADAEAAVFIVESDAMMLVIRESLESHGLPQHDLDLRGEGRVAGTVGRTKVVAARHDLVDADTLYDWTDRLHRIVRLDSGLTKPVGG